jgi:hypothetical protein
MTINPEDYDKVEFYLNNLVEDWWNPSEGEFPLVNPHEAFIEKMKEFDIDVVDCRK